MPRVLPPAEPPAFRLIETMRHQGGVRLLEYHLARITRSALVLGFAFDAGEFVRRLHGLEIERGAAYRVRMLLAVDGGMAFETTALDRPSAGPVRLHIASERLSTTDLLCTHKTTWRDVYDRAWREAHAEGCDEALLLNERGEVCEGSRTNLFARIGPTWATPPLDAGPLPGVYRRYLLRKYPFILERPITPEALRRADALYVTNAVRGLREAALRIA